MRDARTRVAIDAARASGARSFVESASAARLASAPAAAPPSRLRSFVESASFGDDVLRCKTEDDVDALRRRLLQMNTVDCARSAGSPRTAAKQTIGEMRAAKLHIMSLLSEKKSAAEYRNDDEGVTPSVPSAAARAFSYSPDIPPPSPPAFSLSRATDRRGGRARRPFSRARGR